MRGALELATAAAAQDAFDLSPRADITALDGTGEPRFRPALLSPVRDAGDPRSLRLL